MTAHVGWLPGPPEHLHPSAADEEPSPAAARLTKQLRAEHNHRRATDPTFDAMCARTLAQFGDHDGNV